MASLYDFIRQKFRQSKDYTQDMLIRDLIEAFGEIAGAFEVGDWTPTIRFGGASTGIIYSSQVGGYLRTATFFFAGFDIQLTNKGSAVGSAQIAGLPISSGTGVNNGSGTIGLASGMSGLQSHVIPSAVGSLIDLRHNLTAGTGYGTLSDTNFTNTSRLRGNMFFITP